MTKNKNITTIVTVKLTEFYIETIKKLAAIFKGEGGFSTITGTDMFCYYDRTNLLVNNTGYQDKDIAADHENVPLYKTKTDSLKRDTIDLTNINSTVSVDFYCLKDETSTVDMPSEIADSLIKEETRYYTKPVLDENGEQMLDEDGNVIEEIDYDQPYQAQIGIVEIV